MHASEFDYRKIVHLLAGQVVVDINRALYENVWKQVTALDAAPPTGARQSQGEVTRSSDAIASSLVRRCRVDNRNDVEAPG